MLRILCDYITQFVSDLVTETHDTGFLGMRLIRQLRCNVGSKTKPRCWNDINLRVFLYLYIPFQICAYTFKNNYSLLFSSPEPNIVYEVPMLWRPPVLFQRCSSQTSWPIKAKLHVEILWVGGTRVEFE